MEPPYRLDDAVLLAACREDRFRSGGPGGQHANRTDSAVRLTHAASGIEAQCQDHREQARNRQEALRRLRIRLACGQRGLSDPIWLQPWVSGGRIAVRDHAQDYPAVVAVLLDALDRHRGIVAMAAAELKVSTSQFVKCLAADKDVLHAANRLRAAYDLGALHV
jgi:hypothetical protein